MAHRRMGLRKCGRTFDCMIDTPSCARDHHFIAPGLTLAERPAAAGLSGLR
jgi:hypothetical protein